MNRRELVLAGLAVAVPTLVAPRAASAQTDERELLRSLVGLEQEAAFAYRALAEGGRLGAASELIRLFARQEQEHAEGLIAALRDTGGAAPPGPASEDDVPGLPEALAGGRPAMARFAMALEERALAAYQDAVGTLRTPELLSTAAAIMACEAQHAVALRGALGQDPSPEAFVGRVH